MVDFKYRPDIDGLRAIAVMLVILFHAGLGFPGGFIGVDVFFVISGFLITGLIVKQQEAGHFSLAEFWIRRIRRIVPAVTLMVVLVLLAGAVLFLPSDLKVLAKSAVAQQVLCSNIYFFRNTGYFDGRAELMPLLHTWSLAVEEQFYLIYPFLLVLLNRLGRRPTVVALGAILLVSLALSHYQVRHNTSAAFYLLPARAWELLIGAILWFLPSTYSMPRWLLSALSWCSLVVIVAAACLFSSTTPFPGMQALLPTVAAAVFIYCNSCIRTFPAAMLATGPMVFVGLISYSLYLWHWPILVFGRYCCAGSISWHHALLLIGLSLSAAVASWRYVEMPFRGHAGRFSVYFVICGWFGAAAVILSLSVFIWKSGGFASIYPRELMALDPRTVDPSIFRYEVSGEQLKTGSVTMYGLSDGPSGVDFIIWGDSHAMSLGAYVEDECRRLKVCGAIVARRATAPLARWEGYTEDKNVWNERALGYIIRTKPKHVIMVARWNTHFDEVDENKEAALRSAIMSLIYAGIGVWIMPQVPEQRFPVPQALWLSRRFGIPCPQSTSVSEFREASGKFRAVLKRLPEAVGELDASSDCFDSNGFSIIGSEEGAFYRDADHLSKAGASHLIGPSFLRWIMETSRKHSEGLVARGG